MRFLFGDYVLDLERRELRRGGDLVQVEPQVFDLLAYLVATGIASPARMTCWPRSGTGASSPNPP